MAPPERLPIHTHTQKKKKKKKKIQLLILGNAEIDFDEFCNLMGKKMQESGDMEQEMRDAFKVFDKDGSGTIDAAELKEVKDIHK